MSAPVHEHSASEQETTTEPARGTGSPGSAGQSLAPSAAHVLRLQQTAGNAAVSRMLQRTEPAVEDLRDSRTGRPLTVIPRAALQRISVPAGFSETLQDVPTTAPGAAPPTSYAPTTYTVPASSNYQLTRSSRAVNVQVRILFKNPGGGAIPAGDARRTYAAGMMPRLAGHWTGRFVMTNKPRSGSPPPPGGLRGLFRRTPVSLPINFQATAVWDPTAAHDAEVDLHAQAANLGQARTTTGIAGDTHAIDAGNWYAGTGGGADVRGGFYSASEDAIYAHEYGHLLGIPDEYSLGNPDIHTRLHAIGGGGVQGAAMGRAIDKAGARQLVLDALKPQLQTRVQTIAGAVSEAMAGHKRQMSRQLADALRQKFRSSTVHSSIVAIFGPPLAAQPRARRALREVVRFEAADNMSYADIAKRITDAELSEAGLRTLLAAAYGRAVDAASAAGARVEIPYVEGGTRRTAGVAIGTIGVAGADPLLDTAARDAAAATTGTPAAPTVGPGGRRIPPVYPSTQLIGQLTAMPAGWTGVASLFATQVAALDARISEAATASLAAAPLNPANSVRALYRDVLRRFTQMAEGVTRNAIRSFLEDQMRPHMAGQINQIVGLVNAEADRIAGTPIPPGGGLGGAAAPPDPALAAAARRLHARAQAMQTATATSSTSHIRYSVVSMMGDNNLTPAGGGAPEVRPDNLTGIVSQFNANLKRLGEDDFRADRAGGGGGGGAGGGGAGP